MSDNILIPTDIKLLQKSKQLDIIFNNGEQFSFSCEYLRVYSPSAETRDHKNNQRIFPENKQDVNIISVEPVGNYAIMLYFDDGHRTGIYSWDYLYSLGINYQKNWLSYQKALSEITQAAARPHHGE